MTLADMLLGTPVPQIPAQNSAEPESVKLKEPIQASLKTMSSYELNKHKTCTKPGCDKPRHISKKGKCHATTCTEHYKQDSEKFRQKYLKNRGSWKTCEAIIKFDIINTWTNYSAPYRHYPAIHWRTKHGVEIVSSWMNSALWEEIPQGVLFYGRLTER